MDGIRFDNDMCLYAFEQGEDTWAHICTRAYTHVNQDLVYR